MIKDTSLGMCGHLYYTFHYFENQSGMSKNDESRKCEQMKKIILVVLAALLIVSLVPFALAAGSASLSGPGTVRAGDTITLTFSAGGGIYGGSGSLSYDASQLTLEGHSVHIGGSWAVEFGGERFVFYDNSMKSPIDGTTKIFSVTFKVSDTLAPGTQISVTASGVKLSDGKQDTSVGSASYSVTLAEPLSGNCNLASLSAAEVTLSPAFSPDVTKYSASVPFSVSKLTVSAQAEHGNAKVSVENPSLWAGDTTVIKVTVTAETGAQKEYKIYVARAQDPNYVPSNDAALKELQVEGFLLSPGFDPAVKQYYVWLPYEAEEISLSAASADNKAAFQIGAYEQLIPGAGTNIPVTVTAEDGTEKVYTVTVVRAPEHEKVEDLLARWLEEEVQDVPEQTEPVPTEPVTEPSEPATEPPEPTEPAPAIPETPRISGFVWLLFVAGIVIGAGVTALILLLKKKK